MADGMKGIAVTDHGDMFGIKEFFNYVNSDLTPHKASPLQPNGTFAEYADVYSPLLSQNTRLLLVQSILR